MSGKHFYVTTPIYYANDRPHIGHAYTTLLADVLARYHRLLGYDVFFLTGTDEHGQKVEQAARKRGVSPEEHVKEYHRRFKDLWQRLGIEYDYFIRTTDKDHKEFVQKCLQQLYDRGEIVLREYEGWYSVSEERFFQEDELVDGKDPVGHKAVEWISEKNYFFLMSKYQKRLLAHIEGNADFIQPESRRNEVLGFLRQPLGDLCISRPRTRLAWGISLPFDPDFVTYVWFDALLNYESAVAARCYPDGSPLWPATYHLLGKDILTTHSVYWPTILMALGHPLPQHIFAHGWWLSKGAKQSKSSGNAVDPLGYVDEYGVDAVRYFLLRDMVLGQDASFSEEQFKERINSDLANDLGNALQRVHVFLIRSLGGKVPLPPAQSGADESDLKAFTEESISRVKELILNLRLSPALEAVTEMVRRVNRYLEKRAPWQVAKDRERQEELNTILFTAAEALRCALILLHPVMPEKVTAGLAMLGVTHRPSLKDLSWGVLPSGSPVEPAGPLFPRIESVTQTRVAPPQKEAGLSIPVGRLDLRAGRIVQIDDHPSADKLYVLQVNLGSSTRTIVAGLKESHSRADLLNRPCIVLTNLKAARLRGVESQGMLLAASKIAGPELLNPGDVAAGTQLSFQGVEPRVEERLSLENLKEAQLEVRGGRVTGSGHELFSGGKPVLCDAPDGTEVR